MTYIYPGVGNALESLDLSRNDLNDFRCDFPHFLPIFSQFLSLCLVFVSLSLSFCLIFVQHRNARPRTARYSLPQFPLILIFNISSPIQLGLLMTCL